MLLLLLVPIICLHALALNEPQIIAALIDSIKCGEEDSQRNATLLLMLTIEKVVLLLAVLPLAPTPLSRCVRSGGAFLVFQSMLFPSCCFLCVCHGSANGGTSSQMVLHGENDHYRYCHCSSCCCLLLSCCLFHSILPLAISMQEC